MEFTENVSEKRDSANIKRQIQRYLRYWPVFLASILLALVVAYIYLRYVTPQYMSKSSLYVKSASAGKGEMMGLRGKNFITNPLRQKS